MKSADTATDGACLITTDGKAKRGAQFSVEVYSCSPNTFAWLLPYG